MFIRAKLNSTDKDKCYRVLVALDWIKEIVFISDTEAEIYYKTNQLGRKDGTLHEDWTAATVDGSKLVALLESHNLILK